MRVMYLSKNNISYLSYKAVYSNEGIFKFLFIRLFDPLMHYLLFAAITISLMGSEYLEFIIIGNVVFYTAHEMIIKFLTLLRAERFFGTFQLNIAAPASINLTIIKKAVIPILDSLFIFITSLLFVWLLFDINFAYVDIGYLIVIIFVLMISLFGISLFIAGLSLILENVNLFFNIFVGILQIFCGVNFSIEILPDSIQIISKILPTTHSISNFRLLLEGDITKFWTLLFSELYIGVLYIVLGLLFLNIMLYISRKGNVNI